eukprot:scaffold1727_cov198-Alexandrium_tamarense.AAC.10
MEGNIYSDDQSRSRLKRPSHLPASKIKERLPLSSRALLHSPPWPKFSAERSVANHLTTQ